MATPADEFSPEDAIVEQFVVDIIQRHLSRLESGGIPPVIKTPGLPPLVAELSIWVRDNPVDSFVVSSAESHIRDAETNGAIRVRFRRTYKDTRHLWQLESIFPEISPTGFTGFGMAGDIKLKADGIDIQYDTFTGRHNHLDWEGWT